MADDIRTIVTARPDEGVKSSYATTPGANTANFLVQALSPLRLVMTRVVRVYLQSVTGIVTAGMSGLDTGMLPNDFWTLFILACKMSVAIGGITALQNITELMNRVDQNYPELRA